MMKKPVTTKAPAEQAVKVGPIRSVLRGGYVSVLVTDEETATTILRDGEEPA